MNDIATTNTNFTSSLPRDVLARAKIIAAQRGTSVNALLNAELRHLVETYDGGEQTRNTNYQHLLDFSLGRSDYEQTMTALALDSEEALFLLMAKARLPMPRLSESETDAMVASLINLG